MDEYPKNKAINFHTETKYHYEPQFSNNITLVTLSFVALLDYLLFSIRTLCLVNKSVLVCLKHNDVSHKHFT